MGTSPSGQDTSQMDTLTENMRSEEGALNRFFVRCITNKKGEYNFAVFQYDLGIALTEAPWGISLITDPEREEYWKEQIKENVSELKTIYGGKQFGIGLGHQGYQNEFDEFNGYGYGGYYNGYGKDDKKKKGRPQGKKGKKGYAFQNAGKA